MASTTLKFQNFGSRIDVSFWHELAERKLNVYRLDASAQPLVGAYNLGTPRVPSLMAVSEASFVGQGLDDVDAVAVAGDIVGRGGVPVRGTLYNVNTVEEFKTADKKALLAAEALKIWDGVASGEAAAAGSTQLARFVLLTFADLKTHKFLYWFGFPGLVSRPEARVAGPPRALSTLWNASPPQVAALHAALAAPPAHGVAPSDSVLGRAAQGAGANAGSTGEDTKGEGGVVAVSVGGAAASAVGCGVLPFFWLHAAGDGGGEESEGEGGGEAGRTVAVHPLSWWDEEDPSVRRQQVAAGELVAGFRDPCSLPAHPGWPLRNFLLLAGRKWGVPALTVLCYRGDDTGAGGVAGAAAGGRGVPASIVLDVVLGDAAEATGGGAGGGAGAATTAAEAGAGGASGAGGAGGVGGAGGAGVPASTGWEPNARGKMGPRVVNLRASMDPRIIAETSVDLNINLMRWRQLPDLDLEGLKTHRALLIGAGTLGCSVARSLLGWGIRNVTFVDNGKVSFSNPVRQTLYEFEDCLDGGRNKAEAAAERLCRVFPGVVSTGEVMAVPMPGHPVAPGAETETVMKAVARLEELVSEGGWEGGEGQGEGGGKRKGGGRVEGNRRCVVAS